MDPQSPDQASTSRLPLIAIGALIVLAVVIGIAYGLSGPKDFADGTPEAALQDYLDAAIEGDAEAVLALLGAEQQQRCAEDLKDRLWVRDGVGFALDEVQVVGDTASATVNERYSSGDPFGGTSRGGTQDFELRLEAAGDWRITDASWPYSLRDCLKGES